MITFEWASISGVNDDVDTARRLGNLLKGILCKINVIPLNPTDGFLGKKPSADKVNEFCAILKEEFNITATPRVRRGIDIDAGCGQLATKLLLLE